MLLPEWNQIKIFRLLIINFANQAPQILKGQVVASAQINPICLMRITQTTQKVLGIASEYLRPSRELSEPLRFLHALSSATPEEEGKDSLDTLKPDHLPAERGQTVLDDV